MTYKKKVEKLIEGMMGNVLENLYSIKYDYGSRIIYQAEYDVLLELYQKVKSL